MAHRPDPLRTALEQARRRSQLLALDTEASTRMDLEPRDQARQPEVPQHPPATVRTGPRSGHAGPPRRSTSSDLAALADAVRDGRLPSGASLEALADLRRSHPGTTY